MLFKFRWLIAAIIVALLLICGTLLDLAPRWQSLEVMRQEKNNLANKIATLPSATAMIPFKQHKYILSEISKLAAQQHVIINKLSESTNQQVHLVAHGAYADMLVFINALFKKHHAVFVGFSYQGISHNEVRFIVDMNLSNMAGSVFRGDSTLSAQNPFCGQAGGNTRFSLRDEGRTISLDLQNNNLSDTVRLLAKFSEVNVIVSQAVEGNVTLHLQHAKPADVFEMLLDSYGLEKLQRGNVWYIASRDELIKRKQQQVKWQNLSYQAANLTTETWQIRYGKADDIARMLQDGKNTFLSVRGQVRVDARSNIICVQDVPERMLAIKKLIAKLDKPIQQVQIEARLASVESDYERELGVDFSVQAHGATVTPGRYSIAVAHLPDGSQLDVKLAALENDGHADLISRPSLYTANQQAAVIEAGEEVPYQEVSESGGTAVAFKKAVLALKVTPQVLPGGYVLLQLRINQDRPSNRLILGMPTITTRQILTNVLVKSGQTAVLGGIYENQDEKAMRRIPLLGDVPVIGELFTVRAVRQAKRELLIFVTPKIMTRPL